MAYIEKTNRVFFVSPTGNNSNDGLAPDRAWLNLTKVNSYTFTPGDIIAFQGGYEFAGTLTITTSGTDANPITYTSYGSTRATILSSAATGLSSANKGNYVIDNLIFKGTNQPTTWTYDGISIGTGSALKNITIKNTDVIGYSGQGIGVYSGGASQTITNFTIENCVLKENMNGIYFTRPSAGTSHVYFNVKVLNTKTHNNLGFTAVNYTHTGSGIILGGVSTGLIEECESFGNGWNNGGTAGGPIGIWCFESTGVTIRNCESHNNGTGTGSARKDGGGFDIDGGCQNCVIEYCYSHDNAGGGFAFFEFGSTFPAFTGNVIRYNISVRDARLSGLGALTFWSGESGFTNNRVHNNLFIVDGDSVVSGTVYAIRYVGGTLGTLNIVNNIFIIDGGNATMLSGTASGTWSNNLFYAVNGANLNYSTGGITGNPYLIDYAVEPITVGAAAQKGVRNFIQNYQCHWFSPCINAGTSTISGYTFPTRDFWGQPAPVGVRNIGPGEQVP